MQTTYTSRTSQSKNTSCTQDVITEQIEQSGLYDQNRVQKGLERDPQILMIISEASDLFPLLKTVHYELWDAG